MCSLDGLFANNKAWSAQRVAQDPQYFTRLARQQAPRYLWIGCSDSRVPANEIVGLLPGEVFVHRNVANLVQHTDLNCQAVVQFAVDVLRVRYLMVVGHYGCGGIQAVVEKRRIGLAGLWLQNVEDVCHIHSRRLGALPSNKDRADRLCELNVIEQVSHVSRLPTVTSAWSRAQPLSVHGFVYGLHDGLLRNLGATVTGPEDIVEWRRAALKKLWGRPSPRHLPARVVMSDFSQSSHGPDA